MWWAWKQGWLPIYHSIAEMPIETAIVYKYLCLKESEAQAKETNKGEALQAVEETVRQTKEELKRPWWSQ